MQGQHPQQPIDPNRNPMSMAAYKNRQGQPSSGASSLSQNQNLQNSQTRSTPISMGDQMHQNRKRVEQSHHHSSAKKAQLSSNVPNSLLVPGSLSVPPSSSNRFTGDLTSHQSFNENKDKGHQQSMAGIDTSFHSSQLSQNKYTGNRNSANPTQQLQSRSWQQPPNTNRTDIVRTQQPAQVKKSIFDIDSPPPIPNQSKPFDKMPLDRTESLEPGEILDEDSQDTQKLQLQLQPTAPIGTAPNTTVTPLQQRLFGSSGQNRDGSPLLAKNTSSSKELKEASQRSERKYGNPLLSAPSSALKTQSPVKQGKLNVLGASSTLDPIKQEISAANRRSLFSPPSDTEGQAGGSQASPFKVVKSPANNNRHAGTNRDGRRTYSNSTTGENRSPRVKHEVLKAENIEGYGAEKSNSLMHMAKQENPNMTSEFSDSMGPNRNLHSIKDTMKIETNIDEKPISTSLSTKVMEHPESQSYDSPSERHKKHKKDKKKKKHKEDKKHDRDKERGERKEKDRSSSKHHSHSKHSSEFHGSEHHPQHKSSSNR